MTPQAIFDKVAKHLLTQKVKAVSVSGTYLYRSPFGHKCAVGCLIPDELYDERFEGRQFVTLVGMFPETIKSIFGDMPYKLLSDLQSIHDDTQPETWFDRLKETAQSFKLSTEVLDAFATGNVECGGSAQAQHDKKS
jgi:hypothetical protein